MVSLRKRPHSGTEQTAHQTSASRPSNSVETNPTERKSPEAKPQPAGPLQRLRNNWYFANLCQWIYLFGQAVKIPDEIDVDRIEPYGWDSEDRSYYVLDDNRLYRMTDAPESTPPPSKSKKSRKSQRSGGRSSKRRRVGQATGVDSADAEEEDAASESISDDAARPIDDGLGGAKWECIAVGYSEVMSFLATLQKTKDENEKVLRDQIKRHLLPILEKQENSRKRKQQQRNKELENLSKMANAKRSSRLAVKQEQKTMEENAKEEERIQHENQAKARKEEQIMLKREKERDQRLRARERRMKDRESRKLLYQQELARLSSQSTEAAAAM
ncbi:hypothetical protein CFO_g1518 [Ceratocystis platani]|uniref:Uncharacterized protein n=1 Tax=Ceratocystis fimbriata f. sp. platani TaxID=88771 RepID=A0A0F8DJS3_CERFI|nr:hypothetical protein CFO_g1518 [Ceratocystis platani]